MAMGFQLDNTKRWTLPAPHCRNGSCRYVRAICISLKPSKKYEFSLNSHRPELSYCSFLLNNGAFLSDKCEIVLSGYPIIKEFFDSFFLGWRKLFYFHFILFWFENSFILLGNSFILKFLLEENSFILLGNSFILLGNSFIFILFYVTFQW